MKLPYVVHDLRHEVDEVRGSHTNVILICGISLFTRQGGILGVYKSSKLSRVRITISYEIRGSMKSQYSTGCALHESYGTQFTSNTFERLHPPYTMHQENSQ